MFLEPVDPNARFRARRRRARRRRAIRRISVLALVAVAAAATTLGARSLGEGEPIRASAEQRAAVARSAPAPARPEPRPLPAEMRGVHVTMALASLEGKLDQYLALTAYGLNTIELDVKDENGHVAFLWPKVALAHRIGAARPYYKAREAAQKIRDRGVYLIGRVVVFEDPVLAERRPDMAVRTTGGGVWGDNAGLGWTNPYDERVWRYNVDVAEAAVRAGFDEIMFDYVRFPSDGDLSVAVFEPKKSEAKSVTIARFLAYARERLRPLGARVSAAVFGLSATRALGIGQKPRRLARQLDALYPMVYPSHYKPGEYDLDDPSADPGTTVARALQDFRRALRGQEAKLIPWLQDFSLGRAYGPEDVQAQIEAARGASSAGFLLWNPSGLYTPEALRAP